MSEGLAHIPEPETVAKNATAETIKASESPKAKELQDQLKKFFAPKLIEWSYPALTHAGIGQKIYAYPLLHPDAIRQRMDAVLGPENWSEQVDFPSIKCTRLTLTVRFTDGGEWVERTGIHNSEDFEIGQEYALRKAARALGIGQYLRQCIQLAEVIEVKESFLGKGIKSEPKIPQKFVPFDFQNVTRESARSLRDLVKQACDESTAKGRKYEEKDAVRELTARYELIPAEDGHVNLALLLNWELTEIRKRVMDWISDIAAGRLETANAPKQAPRQSMPNSGTEPKK